MDTVQVRVDIKNKFSAFEQEGDDDVAGELLEKFNQMKEVEALKMARKAAERKKNRPKKPVPIEVAPKKDSISTRKTESTAEEPTNADNPASKTEADSATEVKDTKTLNDDKTPRERVVYSGGKEFTKKTNSKFAAKMMALAREAEESARAKTDIPFRGRGGFRRGREGFVKPAGEANVTATEEVASGHFEEVQKSDRPFRGREGFRRGRGGFREDAREVPFFENAAPANEYSSPSKFEGNSRDSRPYNGRGGFRRGRVGFTSNQVQEVPSSENAAVEEAPASQLDEKPRSSRPYRGRGGFRRGRGGFREDTREVPFFENAAPANEYSSPSKFEGNSRDSRPYNGRGGFRRGRVGFTSNQVQEVPSSENAAVEAAPASRFEEKPRSSRPYRGRGGFRGDREGFYKQTVETEPEEKQYTLDEWKKMQAEIRMKSSLNVAKANEGAKENKTEDKVKVEDVVEQRNSKTNVEIKFGSASYYDGRGRGGMDRRAPRTVAEVPNVLDESVFPLLK